MSLERMLLRVAASIVSIRFSRATWPSAYLKSSQRERVVRFRIKIWGARKGAERSGVATDVIVRAKSLFYPEEFI